MILFIIFKTTLTSFLEMSEVKPRYTKDSRGSRSRYWCLTVNNYTESDIENLKALYPEKAGFIVIGKEKAPTTGTPHL